MGSSETDNVEADRLPGRKVAAYGHRIYRTYLDTKLGRDGHQGAFWLWDSQSLSIQAHL